MTYVQRDGASAVTRYVRHTTQTTSGGQPAIVRFCGEAISQGLEDNLPQEASVPNAHQYRRS